jgi:hypothetical protein
VLAIVHLAFARSPSSAVVMALVVVLAVFLVCAQLAEAGLPFAGVVDLQTLLTEHLRSVLLGIVGAALVLMLSLIDISSTAVALLLVVIALAAVVTTIGALTRTLETND